MGGIILFDHSCIICHQSVQFIIKHDKKGYFQFASLYSDVAKELIQQYGIPDGFDSLVLLERDRYYLMSTAALRICKQLDGIWKLGGIFLLIPKPIRNRIYSIIAKNRHHLSGKTEQCPLPTEEMRKRILS